MKDSYDRKCLVKIIDVIAKDSNCDVLIDFLKYLSEQNPVHLNKTDGFTNALASYHALGRKEAFEYIIKIINFWKEERRFLDEL